MATFTKVFRLIRLPAPREAPHAWRTYLTDHWSAVSPRWARVPAASVHELRVAIARYMPGLLPDWDALADSLADWDLGRLQMLSNWNLVPFFDGCSIARSMASGHPTLLRNYDIGTEDHRGCLHLESSCDGHWMLGSAETGWGFVDGVNDRGLAAAIAFGGDFSGGDGWSIPVLMRYMLNICATVEEAAGFLESVPHTMCQNFLLVDAQGGSNVVYASADRGVRTDRGATECSNHQGEVREPKHAAFTRTVERLDYLRQAAGSLRLPDMMRPPLYSNLFKERFGTVYSVEYDPVLGAAHFAWPDATELLLGPDSPETQVEVTFTEPDGAGGS
jgi:predicted choloylglycine hydrolase